MTDLLILALPWQRYDTTAIQLGALQSFVKMSGFSVDTRHFYKDLINYISPDIYMKIFEAYMGECIFAAILYPDRYEVIKSTVAKIMNFQLPAGDASEQPKHPQLNSNLSAAERKQISQASEAKKVDSISRMFDFDSIVDSLNVFIEDVYANVEWGNYKAIGFTTSHQQLIPTIILARMIKKDFPDTPIIIGGALMTRGIPEAILELFTEFDFIVSGEGEVTLLELMRYLTDDCEGIQLGNIKGLHWRQGHELRFNGERDPVHDMDIFPPPDYDDYFQHALKNDGNWVFPKLTLEASRACVWGKCIYCNLNLQWKNLYRRKSHSRMAEEIEAISQKYKSNVITLCDTNVIDKIPLFEMIARKGKDYRILAEVSPHMTKRGMKALRDAGVRTIQVGIESFSQRILDLYGRGHTVMRSIEMLKWAAEYDLEIYYNIIINFPLDESQDVQRSQFAMKAASHFMYPAIHDFSFSLDSPAYNNKEHFNIADYEFPEEIVAIYPKEIVRRLGHMFALTVVPIPVRPTGVSWIPVIEDIGSWKKRYHANLGRPGITYLDSGSFITVSVKNGGDGNDVNIILEDEYRELYLACDNEAITLDEICKVVPQISKIVAAGILDELITVGVVYSDLKKYFGLAIRERSVGNYPNSASYSNFGINDQEFEHAESRTKKIRIKLPIKLVQHVENT